MQNPDLYDEIMAYEFGGLGQEGFARRLAECEGINRVFASDVVQEYLRFVYLAIGTRRSVTPSRPVDAAWHLHLTLSDYGLFCDAVLGRNFAHVEDRSLAGKARHKAQYPATKEVYVAEFGEVPDPRYWPGAKARDSLRLFAGALIALMLGGTGVAYFSIQYDLRTLAGGAVFASICGFVGLLTLAARGDKRHGSADCAYYASGEGGSGDFGGGDCGGGGD